MIPIEVTQTPWHYTGLVDALDHWQTFIAGLLALGAAFQTIRQTRRIADKQIEASGEDARKVIAATREQTEATFRQIEAAVNLERERASRELDALRKALAVELRLQISRAFSVYDGLRELSSASDEPISARMVEAKSRMPAPIIYSANAGKIGLLEGDAMGVAIVYTTLEGARLRTDRLATIYNTPDDIGPDVVMETANVFLAACGHAQGLLPRLRTGDASYDAQDEALLKKIKAALATGRA